MIASTDPISDMLARIRNAIMVNKNTVNVPYSKIKHNTIDVIKKQGYVDSVAVSGEDNAKMIVITINDIAANPKITHIKRVSKPGRRMYAKSSQIPVVKNGRGIVVVSTSRGVMSGSDAQKQSLGGEIICEVY